MSTNYKNIKAKHRFRPYEETPPPSRNKSGSASLSAQTSKIDSPQQSSQKASSSGALQQQRSSTDCAIHIQRVKEEVEEYPNTVVPPSDFHNSNTMNVISRENIKKELNDDPGDSIILQQPAIVSQSQVVVKSEIMDPDDSSPDIPIVQNKVTETQEGIDDNTQDAHHLTEHGPNTITETNQEVGSSSGSEDSDWTSRNDLEDEMEENETVAQHEALEDVGINKNHGSSETSGATVETHDSLNLKPMQDDQSHRISSDDAKARQNLKTASTLAKDSDKQVGEHAMGNSINTVVKAERDSPNNSEGNNSQLPTGDDYDIEEDDGSDSEDDSSTDSAIDEERDSSIHDENNDSQQATGDDDDESEDVSGDSDDSPSTDLVLEEDVDFASNAADWEGNSEPDSEMNCVEDEIYDESDAEQLSDTESSEVGDQFMECDGINAEKGTRQKYSLFPTGKEKKDLICSITRQDVADFQHQTQRWYTENRPISANEAYGEIPMTSVKPEGTCAVYRVVSCDGTKLLLQAITVDLWLDGRGDLRDIGMTMHAVNTICGKRFDARKFIFPGDVIFVQRLIPSKFAVMKGSWEEVINTDPRECHKDRFIPLWNVKEYQPVQRITLPDRLAVAAEREGVDRRRKDDLYHEQLEDEEEKRRRLEQIKTLFLAIEGVPDLFRTQTRHLPELACREKDTVMVGTVVVPRGRSAIFSFMPKNLNERQQLFDKYNSTGKNAPPKFGFQFSRLATELEDNYLKRRDSIYQIFSTDYIAGTAWLRRGLALAVPSLGAFERFFMDTKPHTIVLNITQHEQDFVRFEFMVKESLRKRAWRSDRNLLVELSNGNTITSRVTHVSSINNGLKIEAKATGTEAMTLFRNDMETVVVQQVAPTITGLEEEFYSTSEPLNILYEHRFHRALVAAFGGPVLPPINTRPTTSRITYKGTDLTLLVEQAHVLDAALRSTSPFVVPSSFGSGKTFTANVILCRLAEVSPNKLHFIVAQSNFAVVNAVNIASYFDDYKHLRIVRLISPQNMGLREERTEFDLPVLMRRLFSSPEELCRLSLDDRRIAEDYLTLIGHSEDLSWHAKERINRWKRSDWSAAIRIFFQLYNPQRIFCTTSTLMLLAKKDGGMGRAWIDSVDTLVFDEASQLSTPTFALIAHRLPHARPILIGDSKQLEPFVPTTHSPLLRKLATGNLLEHIEINGLWPSFPINSVFRCHPELTTLLSYVFYDGVLRPAVSAAERSGMLNCIRMPNPKYPIAMLCVDGYEISYDTSYFNKEEENYAIQIAQFLKKFVDKDNDIAIICMYRAQADNIWRRIRGDSKIFVGTVDATQGREFRASIVCTTRTEHPGEGPDGVNFFSHSKRVNVALSRSKELLIILGDQEVLTKETNWDDISISIKKNDAFVGVEQFLKDNRGL